MQSNQNKIRSIIASARITFLPTVRQTKSNLISDWFPQWKYRSVIKISSIPSIFSSVRLQDLSRTDLILILKSGKIQISKYKSCSSTFWPIVLCRKIMLLSNSKELLKLLMIIKSFKIFRQLISGNFYLYPFSPSISTPGWVQNIIIFCTQPVHYKLYITRYITNYSL